MDSGSGGGYFKRLPDNVFGNIISRVDNPLEQMSTSKSYAGSTTRIQTDPLYWRQRVQEWLQVDLEDVDWSMWKEVWMMIEENRDKLDSHKDTPYNLYLAAIENGLSILMELVEFLAPHVTEEMLDTLGDDVVKLMKNVLIEGYFDIFRHIILIILEDGRVYNFNPFTMILLSGVVEMGEAYLLMDFCHVFSVEKITDTNLVDVVLWGHLEGLQRLIEVGLIDLNEIIDIMSSQDGEHSLQALALPRITVIDSRGNMDEVLTYILRHASDKAFDDILVTERFKRVHLALEQNITSLVHAMCVYGCPRVVEAILDKYPHLKVDHKTIMRYMSMRWSYKHTTNRIKNRLISYNLRNIDYPMVYEETREEANRVKQHILNVVADPQHPFTDNIRLIIRYLSSHLDTDYLKEMVSLKANTQPIISQMIQEEIDARTTL
jgi:hypothetical protein